MRSINGIEEVHKFVVYAEGCNLFVLSYNKDGKLIEKESLKYPEKKGCLRFLKYKLDSIYQQMNFDESFMGRD